MKNKATNKIRVLVAMSGGVDSSAAAFLLQERGFALIGVTMETGYGNAPEQAAALCEQLKIPHYVVDARAQFEAEVIAPFVDAYLHGETPNPCVACNAKLKFPVFAPLMEQHDAAFFATGHYAKIEVRNNRYVLCRGKDEKKDQSYFLYQLTQDILRQCLFPLGDYDKEQVREIAKGQGLLSATQKDSYDICFIKNGNYRTFLAERAIASGKSGQIVDSAGNVLGQHTGLQNYTIGQRKGLQLALGYPAYVTDIEPQSGTVTIGRNEQLYTNTAYTKANHFILFEQLTAPLEATVRIRYKAAPQRAMLSPLADRDEVRIDFFEPVWGISPGQSAVFYDQDYVIGGGILLRK